jgi:hypothetical protein
MTLYKKMFMGGHALGTPVFLVAWSPFSSHPGPFVLQQHVVAQIEIYQTWWYSIDRKFHADDEKTQESWIWARAPKKCAPCFRGTRNFLFIFLKFMSSLTKSKFSYGAKSTPLSGRRIVRSKNSPLWLKKKLSEDCPGEELSGEELSSEELSTLLEKKIERRIVRRRIVQSKNCPGKNCPGTIFLKSS